MNVDEELDAREQELQSEQDRQHGRDLLNRVDFGLVVQQFLDGPIGRRLAADADREFGEIGRQLIYLDPREPEQVAEIQRLRFRAQVVREWRSAFAAYIEDGKQAEIEFQENA